MDSEARWNESSPFDDEFYRRHRVQFLRVAALLTGSRQLAEDALQDTFVRLQVRDDVNDPVAFARVALVNRCRDIVRYEQRRRRDRVVREASADVEASTVETVTVENMALSERLSRLGERQRTAIVLRHLLDLDDDEIAQLLRCRPGTVRSLISRGLAALREDGQ
jgi:RNA polymerase sigma factor (sigma-70 family)